MLNKAALIFLPLLIGVASADEPSYPTVAPKYDYTWQVQDDYSSLNYGQKESRDGDNTVGSYFVLLPDGRTQKVSYTVDPYGGYQATVTYEGEAQPYEAQGSSYKPVKTSYPKAQEKKDSEEYGQVYYKPVEEAPEPQVYYKPLDSEPVPSKVYYKPIDA